jgi:hypothetical protein
VQFKPLKVSNILIIIKKTEKMANLLIKRDFLFLPI